MQSHPFFFALPIFGKRIQNSNGTPFFSIQLLSLLVNGCDEKLYRASKLDIQDCASRQNQFSKYFPLYKKLGAIFECETNET